MLEKLVIDNFEKKKNKKLPNFLVVHFSAPVMIRSGFRFFFVVVHIGMYNASSLIEHCSGVLLLYCIAV